MHGDLGMPNMRVGKEGIYVNRKCGCMSIMCTRIAHKGFTNWARVCVPYATLETPRSLNARPGGIRLNVGGKI